MKDLYDVRDSITSLMGQKPRPEIEVPLEQALNITLSQDVYANHDSPPFSNSAMDGYALGSLDSTSFIVKGVIFAGDLENLPTLQAGEAVRIFTGAKIPVGAKAVVMQEFCHEQDGVLTIEQVEVNKDQDSDSIKTINTIKENENIRLQGEEFKQGQLLLKAGTTLKAAHLALLASQNITKVKAESPLRIGVLSSGNELKSLGEPLEVGQIIDSNRIMLISLLKEFGGIEIVDMGIVRDDANAVKDLLSKASQNLDVLLISGGASVGEADFAVKALQELGTLSLHKVAIKPGKPFGLGFINRTAVFILPGNPVSAFVTYHLLTRYAIAKLLHINLHAKTLTAIADFDFTAQNKRRQFLRVKLSYAGPVVTAHYIAEQGSGMLSGCAQADALLEVPPLTEVKKGQAVTIYIL